MRFCCPFAELFVDFVADKVVSVICIEIVDVAVAVGVIQLLLWSLLMSSLLLPLHTATVRRLGEAEVVVGGGGDAIRAATATAANIR